LNLYFCDSCGQRYSEQGVAAETVTTPSTQTAQNLCQDCRKKAAAAQSPESDHLILIMPPVGKARPSAARIAAQRRSTDEARPTAVSQNSKSNKMIYAGVAGAVIAVALALVLTSGGSKQTSTQSTQAAAQIQNLSPEPPTQNKPEPAKEDTAKSGVGHPETSKNTPHEPALTPVAKPITHTTSTLTPPAPPPNAALEQLTHIIEKLRELNPGYDGKEAHKLTAGHVSMLTIPGESLLDITPLHDLSTLEELFIQTPPASKSKLGDLAPLTGLKLTSLTITSAAVSSLEPLSGMPLTFLELSGNPITSFAPLKGMKLRDLSTNSALITDILPLEGMPLEKLAIGYSRTSDLSVLKGMPLASLILYNCVNVKDISPVQGMPLKHLSVHGTNVSDLSPIRGMQLTTLQVSCSKVTDLSPAAGMPLTTMELGQTKVKDLSPLKGAPLTALILHGSTVEDLSPIEGMPLTKLNITGTPIKNLSFLKTLPTLTDLQVDLKSQEDVELVRALPKLKTLNNKPAHEILDSWKPPTPKK
jgi:hypothetical protein